MAECALYPFHDCRYQLGHFFLNYNAESDKLLQWPLLSVKCSVERECGEIVLKIRFIQHYIDIHTNRGRSSSVGIYMLCIDHDLENCWHLVVLAALLTLC